MFTAHRFLACFAPLNPHIEVSVRGQVAVGDLEFRRVDRFTFPRSGRLMYSAHWACHTVLESAPLALTVTGDEGEAGENIQVNVCLCPARRFIR